MKQLILVGIFSLSIFSADATVLDTIRMDTASYTKLAKENKDLNSKLISFSRKAKSATESQIKYIESLSNIPLANALKLNEALLDSAKARLGRAKDFQTKLASHESELGLLDAKLHPKKKEQKIVDQAYKARADRDLPGFFAKNAESKEEIDDLIKYFEGLVGDVEKIVEKQRSRVAQGYE